MSLGVCCANREGNCFAKLALIFQVLRLKMMFVFVVVCWGSTAPPEEAILVIMECGKGLGSRSAAMGAAETAIEV